MVREHYIRQIDSLRENLLRLGSMVEHALVRAIRCLETWDISAAAQIIHDDAQIDTVWRTVEEQVITLLATQQPVLGDLRLATAVIAIAGELERIGDYANSIARRVRRIVTRPAMVTPPSRLSEMAAVAQRMLRVSLDAFLRQDVALARSLGPQDEQVDRLEQQLRAELIALAQSDPRTIEASVDMLDIIHALERVADRATNIGERVIYLATNDYAALNP